MGDYFSQRGHDAQATQGFEPHWLENCLTVKCFVDIDSTGDSLFSEVKDSESLQIETSSEKYLD